MTNFYKKLLDIYLQRDFKKLNAGLKKFSLSQCERSLIEARILLHKKDYNLAKEKIIQINTSSNFYNTERFLVLGNIYSCLGLFEKAAQSNIQAIELFRDQGLNGKLSIVTYNAAVSFERLGLNNLAIYYYQESNRFSETLGETIMVERALACRFSKNGNFAEAISSIEKVLSQEKKKKTEAI